MDEGAITECTREVCRALKLSVSSVERTSNEYRVVSPQTSSLSKCLRTRMNSLEFKCFQRRTEFDLRRAMPRVLDDVRKDAKVAYTVNTQNSVNSTESSSTLHSSKIRR